MPLFLASILSSASLFMLVWSSDFGIERFSKFDSASEITYTRGNRDSSIKPCSIIVYILSLKEIPSSILYVPFYFSGIYLFSSSAFRTVSVPPPYRGRSFAKRAIELSGDDSENSKLWFVLLVLSLSADSLLTSMSGSCSNEGCDRCEEIGGGFSCFLSSSFYWIMESREEGYGPPCRITSGFSFIQLFASASLDSMADSSEDSVDEKELIVWFLRKAESSLSCFSSPMLLPKSRQSSLRLLFFETISISLSTAFSLTITPYFQ